MITYGAELWIYYGYKKKMLATKITKVSWYKYALSKAQFWGKVYGCVHGLIAEERTNPKICDFIQYLQSVEGGMHSESTARDLAVDVSKICIYCHPNDVNWSRLLDTKARKFRKFLVSIEGHQKSETVAQAISNDVSKVLYFIQLKEQKWGSLLQLQPIVDFFDHMLGVDGVPRWSEWETPSIT